MENISSVKNLLGHVSQVVKNHEKTLRSTGNGFSFIHALDLERDEARFHTRFIRYLLNPEAGHYQGDKFLKLFFDVMEIGESTGGFIVEIEKPIGKRDWENVEGGRIDLLISNKSTKIAYAIEVKIYALEQREQLRRYSNYLSREFKDEKSKVFFLTLEGGQSESHKTFEKYTCISFSTRMLKWIEECLHASIDQPLIRETLSQYISNIKRLTNQNPDNQMNQEILNLITRDADSFKAFEAINSSQTKLYQIFGENLVRVLKENTDLKEMGFQIELSSKKIPNTDAEISFRFENSSSERIMLYWLGKGIIAIGMHTGNKPIQQLRLKMKEKLAEHQIGNYRDYDGWAWLSEIDELRGQPQLTFKSWEKFQSKELAEKIASWVSQIADAYREVIQGVNSGEQIAEH